MLRGPFGRSAWHMQLRHLSRHQQGMKSEHNNPGRPVPMEGTRPKQKPTAKCFPDKLHSIPMTKA